MKNYLSKEPRMVSGTKEISKSSIYLWMISLNTKVVEEARKLMRQIKVDNLHL
jgi:hypothetical protein